MSENEDLKAALADARAALAASERRAMRAEEETRVARRERDDAVESAARLRECLRTFAVGGDEEVGVAVTPGSDPDSSRTEPVKRGGAPRSVAADADDDATTDRNAPPDVTSALRAEGNQRESLVAALRAKLDAALAEARRATSALETANRRLATAVAERAAAAAENQTRSSTPNEQVLRDELEFEKRAHASAREQLAETQVSASRREKRSKDERDHLREGDGAGDGAGDGDDRRSALLSEMETSVTRLANTLRDRERELDTTRATVATLLIERGALATALDACRREGEAPRAEIRGDGGEKESAAAGGGAGSRDRSKSLAAVALANARTLASRVRGRMPPRDRPGSRPRTFTSTRTREHE